MPGKSLLDIRHMNRKIWQEHMNRTKRRELLKMWSRQHAAVLEECDKLLAESEAAAIHAALFNAEVSHR